MTELHGKKWGAQHPGTDRSVEGGVYGNVINLSPQPWPNVINLSCSPAQGKPPEAASRHGRRAMTRPLPLNQAV